MIVGIGVYGDGSGATTRGYVLTISSGVMPVQQPVITSISGVGSGTVTVNYSNTIAGKDYVLQYTTNMGAPAWVNVSTNTAAGPTASQTDTTATGAQRYYRVYYTVP